MLTAYTDGACRGNPGPSSCAFAVYDEDLKLIYQQARVLGTELTNNFAEYCALVDLLQWADLRKVEGLTIYCDSSLVINQVQGRWQCTKTELKPLQQLAAMYVKYGKHSLIHIRGHQGIEGNELVDRLCNEVLDEAQEKGSSEYSEVSRTNS